MDKMVLIKKEIPDPTENQKLSELFLAIYFNDLNRVWEIKRNYPEIYKKKHFFFISEGKKFDLVYLTLFNLIFWFGDMIGLAAHEQMLKLLEGFRK